MKASRRDLFVVGYPQLDRYSDIKPFIYNTIKISSPYGYINASPINIGEKQNLFISTQGPKQETIEDFWTMVNDLNSKVIIMLCNEYEGGRKKCERYWEKNMNRFKIIIQRMQEHYMYCIREINRYVDQLNTGQKPIIVHCSAGVGRTGTYVSMYLLEKEIDRQIGDKCPIIRINVFNLVRKIKEMRLYMVQTPQQYLFVYLFVDYLLKTRNT